MIPLTLFAVGGVLLRERAVGPHLSVSVAIVVLGAALPLAGPVGSALIGLLSYVAVIRQRLRTRLFNAVMNAALAAAGAMTYLLLGGVSALGADPGGESLLLRIGFPLLVAYLVMAAFNVLAIGAMSAILRGTRVLQVAWQTLARLGWGYLSHVIVAFLFVVLWGPAGLGPLSALFVLGPLVVAHWTTSREVVARREQQETLATFVAALEEADPASVGHSAQVAAIADQLGRQLGIRGRAAESLHAAALLHDIGLITMHRDLSAGDHDLSRLSAIITHPEAGAAVLEGVESLDGAMAGIVHHHERFDGRGYPAGLAGEEIPLDARIIAVADAYTSVHSGSEDRAASAAMRQLHQAAATGHLDPTVVDALDLALARGLIPAPESIRPASERYPGRGDWNHDHPDVSAAFADWQPESGGKAE